MFIVIYAKVIDGKKKGISMDGPFSGPECIDEDEAEEIAASICSESRDIVLVRVFDLGRYTYDQAMEEAKSYFDKIYQGMETAAKMIEKPIRKRKKKKKRPKAKIQSKEKAK